jgi:23S rRNA (cytidine2498-2'-O)-methyltransferase
MLSTSLFRPSQIVALCRPGFEADAGQELTQLAETLGCYGYLKFASGQGYLEYHGYDEQAVQVFYSQLQPDELIFTRDLFLALPLLDSLSSDNRVAGILDALVDGPEVAEIHPLQADTNEGKSLARLGKKLVPPLKQALVQQKLWNPKSDWFLNLLLLTGTQGFVGISHRRQQARWRAGIAHLKMPPRAPSRSTLKLDEAILFFLSKEQQEQLFGLGKTAVDLGASPGGWTYQLTRRDLQVMAIDNGDMDKGLMASGQVEHIRADGFRFRPPFRVNWLVCDMIEQPSRIAELMARWIADGAAERAIFNLKLPMKKRFQEVMVCSDIISQILADQPFQLRIKHLYHDREEVTCYLSLND